MAMRYLLYACHAVTNHVVYSTNLNSERWLSVSIRGCFETLQILLTWAITCKMLGFTQPTSAKLHRLSLIEGTGSLLSSNRLVCDSPIKCVMYKL